MSDYTKQSILGKPSKGNNGSIGVIRMMCLLNQHCRLSQLTLFKTIHFVLTIKH